MADNLGVKIGVDVVSSIKLAETQLDAFINKYSGKKINIGNLGSSGSNSGFKQLETQMKAINNFDWNNLKSQLVAQQNEVKLNNLEWKKLETQMKQSNNIDLSNLKIGLASQKSEVAANNLEWKQLETQMKAANNLDWSNLKTQLQGQKSEIAANNAEWKKLETTMKSSNNFDWGITKNAAKDEASLSKLQNQAQTLQNTMAKLGSNSDTGLVFKKDKTGIEDRFTAVNKSLDDYTSKLKKNEITQEEFNAQNFPQQVKNIGSEIKVAGNNMDTLTKKILSNVSAFAQWYLIGGMVSSVVQSLKAGITTVEDLNKSLVNLQMATGGTYDETSALVKSYNLMGQELGATTVEVADSADAWLRQGKTIADTNTLIEDSMVLSKVGMINSADATTYLTSAMKGKFLSPCVQECA